MEEGVRQVQAAQDAGQVHRLPRAHHHVGLPPALRGLPQKQERLPQVPRHHGTLTLALTLTLTLTPTPTPTPTLALTLTLTRCLVIMEPEAPTLAELEPKKKPARAREVDRPLTLTLTPNPHPSPSPNPNPNPNPNQVDRPLGQVTLLPASGDAPEASAPSDYAVAPRVPGDWRQ